MIALTFNWYFGKLVGVSLLDDFLKKCTKPVQHWKEAAHKAVNSALGNHVCRLKIIFIFKDCND